MNKIPMSLFPNSTAKKIAKPFYGLGEIVQRTFPGYDLYLEQSNIDLTEDEFFAISILNGLIYFVVFSFAFMLLLYAIKIPEYLTLGILFGAFFGAMSFLRIVLGIKISILKKIKSIDSNLVFGLKVLLVEINAGVSLFDSVVMVARHELGSLSTVFKEIAKRLNSGEREDQVLKDIATKNPSPFLKKVLWQLISGLKAGSPINQVVQEGLESIERQQKTDIISYGNSLRVLTLMFMMLGVVIPAMGLAFLAVFNSLPGISLGIEIFWIFLGLIVTFQFMLIGFIKSKRPNLMGAI